MGRGRQSLKSNTSEAYVMTPERSHIVSNKNRGYATRCASTYVTLGKSNITEIKTSGFQGLRPGFLPTRGMRKFEG